MVERWSTVGQRLVNGRLVLVDHPSVLRWSQHVLVLPTQLGALAPP